MTRFKFEYGHCSTRTCRKPMGFNPKLVISINGEPICPMCVENILNRGRERLGKMPFPILPNAYTKESFERKE